MDAGQDDVDNFLGHVPGEGTPSTVLLHTNRELLCGRGLALAEITRMRELVDGRPVWRRCRICSRCSSARRR